MVSVGAIAQQQKAIGYSRLIGFKEVSPDPFFSPIQLLFPRSPFFNLADRLKAVKEFTTEASL